MTVHCAIFAFLVLLLGCGKPAVEMPPPPGEISSVSGMIGPAGGRIGMPGGAFLDIPADAIDSSRMFSISATTEAAPFGAVTPVYRFEPDGIIFAHPVTITLPLAEDAPGNLRIFWSKQKESGFEEIGGSKTGRAISAQVLHFSGGYAAPGTGSRTVSGSQIVTYIAPGRITNVPTDLSRLQPLIYTQTGQRLAGQGFADGTFRVSNVPDGPYLLNIGNDFYVTDSSVFDAGRVSAGRPDAVLSTKPTALRFTLTKLFAWQDGEKLEAFSAENDTWWFEISNNLTPGSTTLSNFSFDHTQAVTSYGDYGRGFLIDGTRGDFLTLAQLSKRTS